MSDHQHHFAAKCGAVYRTAVLAEHYDALAQRCRELEIEASRLSGWLGDCDRARLAAQQERDTLRAEVERLREIREIASQCAANGGYLSSADLIELRELLKK